MKRYTMSFAAAMEHKPEFPERTGRRDLLSFDVEFQVWPSRAALLKTVQIQDRAGTVGSRKWRPVVKDSPYATPEGKQS